VQPRQRAHVALQPAHAAVLLPLRAPPQQGQVAERRLARRQPPEAPPPPHRAPGKLTRCRGHRGGAPGRRAAAERVALLGSCAPPARWLVVEIVSINWTAKTKTGRHDCSVGLHFAHIFNLSFVDCGFLLRFCACLRMLCDVVAVASTTEYRSRDGKLCGGFLLPKFQSQDADPCMEMQLHPSLLCS
jgi:hypothetical protein